MKRIAPVLATLLLLSSAVCACGPGMAAAAPTPTPTPVPATSTPTSTITITATSTITITPTPVISLVELAGRVCKDEGFPEAAAYHQEPGLPNKILLVDKDGDQHPWNMYVPANLQARSVAELAAVVCLGDALPDRFTVKDCGTYTNQLANRHLFIGTYTQDSRLVEARTGQTIVSYLIRSQSSYCPDSFSPHDDRLIGEILYVNEITWDEILWAIEILTWRDPATPTPTTIAIGTSASRPGPSVSGWTQDFLEDFSPTFSGWDEAAGETVQDGILRWRVQSAGPVYHSRIARPSSFANDVHARLVLRHTQGLASDAYGLVFRSKDESEHLDFLIRDDGTFEFWSSGTRTIHQPSAAIRPGEWNTLEVTDHGPGIYLWINGTLVASFDLEDPAWGQVGLAVNLNEEGVTNYDSTFEFDELEVLEP